jgi:hypothetical protein
VCERLLGSRPTDLEAASEYVRAAAVIDAVAVVADTRTMNAELAPEPGW